MVDISCADHGVEPLFTLLPPVKKPVKKEEKRGKKSAAKSSQNNIPKEGRRPYFVRRGSNKVKDEIEVYPGRKWFF